MWCLYIQVTPEKAIIQLGSDYRSCPQNYKLFHRWCSTLLKIIANLKQNGFANQKQEQRTQRQKQKKQKQQSQHRQQGHQKGKLKQILGPGQPVRYLKEFALSAIGKFMIDFDPSLSIKDAEMMLLGFITHHTAIKQKNQFAQIREPLGGQKEDNNPAKINIFELHAKTQNEIVQNHEEDQNNRSQDKARKHAMMLAVPNLHEISEKFKGVNKEVQANTSIEYQSIGSQANPTETSDVSVTAKPRQKTKQTSTLLWLRQRLNIYAILDMNMYIWGERQPLISKCSPQPNNYSINIPAAKKISKETVVRKISTISYLSESGRKPSKNTELRTNNIPADLKYLKPKKRQQLEANENIIAEQEFKKEGQQNDGHDGQQTREVCIPINDYNPKVSGRASKSKGIKRRDQSTKKVVSFNKKVEQESQAEKNPFQDTKLIIQKPKMINKERREDYSEREKTKEKVESKDQGRKDKKIYTTIVTANDQQMFEHVSSADPNKNLSKSVSHIRNSNQSEDEIYKQRRKGLMPKDLDMFIEDILTRRNHSRSRVFELELQKLDRSNCNSPPKQGNSARLDIHGHHINIEFTKFQPQHSFYNLANRASIIQCAGKRQENQTKQTRILDLLKNPKKASGQQSSMGRASPGLDIHSREFAIEFIQKLQQKNRKITESTMWSNKKNQQIQRLVHKLYLSKERIMPTPNNLEFVFGCIANYLDPILSAYLKMFTHLAEAENLLNSLQLKWQLMSGKKLSYYHRLAPVLRILANSISLSYFGIGKCTKYITTFYKGLKHFRSCNKKLEVYEQLVEGTSIELDIFVRIAYYLSENKSIHFEDQSVQISVVQLQLFFILDSYLTPGEINNLISELRSTNSIAEDRVCLQSLAMRIFKTIGHKKNNLLKKYKLILQVLADDHQSISFRDLMYFIESFPVDKNTRNKILYQSSFHLIYWDNKQPTIPQDRLIFLFESFRFISAQALQKNLIVEYFKIKCEREYKGVYERVLNSPDYVVEAVYRMLFRVPPMLYRLTQQLKGNKSCKKNAPILTVLYNMTMEDEIEKLYISGYLNALSGILLPG